MLARCVVASEKDVNVQEAKIIAPISKMENKKTVSQVCSVPGTPRVPIPIGPARQSALLSAEDEGTSIHCIVTLQDKPRWSYLQDKPRRRRAHVPVTTTELGARKKTA